jgi:hypothetical protein
MRRKIAVEANRSKGIFHDGIVALAAGVMSVLAPTAGFAADPGASAPAGKSSVVTLEKISGSSVPRITLAAKAAERLGIETGKVGEELAVRRQVVGGLIIPAGDKAPAPRPGGGFGGFGKTGAPPASTPQADNIGFGGYARVAAATTPQAVVPAAPVEQPATANKPVEGKVWVLVTLSPGEYERLAKDKPARLFPLATRENSGKDLMAQPTGMQPQEDLKRSMLSLYYEVPGKDHGLAINNRMRVELQLMGAEEKQKAVPYSSIYYDAKGNAWVYVNTAPLTFERQRIVVNRVVGDTALLSEGPAVGTPVVTVGAALLYGTEIFKK